MMLFFTMAFSLSLIALVAGLVLFIWSLHAQGAGKGLAKYAGLFVTILAFISLVLTVICGAWHGGKSGFHRRYMQGDDQMMERKYDMKSIKRFQNRSKMPGKKSGDQMPNMPQQQIMTPDSMNNQDNL